MKSTKQFQPKKHLGQNFLINKNVILRIIEKCELSKDDVVLEIGPGKGALTGLIAKNVKKVIAVEKDKELADELRSQFKDTNVEIIHADFLKYSFNDIPANVKVIGNLPYNIATQIIKKIIKNKDLFKYLFFTVQLEYGLRINADKNTKAYGSFSCFMQYHTNSKILFKISNGAFLPVPKVQSCFMKLDILEEPLVNVVDEDLMFKIIREGFNYRRKMLQNSLSFIVGKKNSEHLFSSLKINPKARAEDLSLNDFAGLANYLSEADSDPIL